MRLPCRRRCTSSPSPCRRTSTEYDITDVRGEQRKGPVRVVEGAEAQQVLLGEERLNLGATLKGHGCNVIGIEQVAVSVKGIQRRAREGIHSRLIGLLLCSLLVLLLGLVRAPELQRQAMDDGRQLIHH
ncbi:hypothetical protein HYQ46_008100 [Verticillium longisporum]|nr:hypothetical protein HYQ46_008100 [Verticillium longisporum]